MRKSQSKQKVVDAAISLFFQKGFDGTSVRDIADHAGVNVSLISYYFKGKQGLLEHAITNYYEAYLQVIEEAMQKNSSAPPLEQLKKLVYVILEYKHQYIQLSSMIHRELSLDTIFVREMTVTYLAKENYLINHLLSQVIKHKSSQEKQLISLQLKGVLVTPYILHQEWREHFIGEYGHKLFVKSYVASIEEWLDFLATK